jgi:hypothetical protein
MAIMEDKAMEEAEVKNKLQEILSGIQRKLKAPKSQFNSFGNYHYRNCEDIIEAVKPLLPDGAYVVVRDSIEMIGSRYYVKADASLNYGGIAIGSSGYAREPESRKGMDESQITGSTSSYARKYALDGLFLIDDTKDADSKDNRTIVRTVQKPENGPVTQLPPAAVAPPQAQDNSGPYIVKIGRQKNEPVNALSNENLAWVLNYYLDKILDMPNSKFREEWEEAVLALQAEKDERTDYNREAEAQ